MTLAGFNVDSTVLAQAEELGIDREVLTPEPLSAAYARISRYRKPVGELRRRARAEVAKARRSNQRIIWEMGHHSVAEHAAFNFDVVGISRLAIEALEHFRLCSYTEKSQRYITLDGDHVLPREVAEAGLSDELVALVERQNGLYREIYERILQHRVEQDPRQAEARAGLRLLEGEAKEDARYVTALATEGQLGMTLNARNLELVVRRFAAHDLEEVRELGRILYREVEQVAPSLVLFTDACDYDRLTRGELARFARWEDDAELVTMEGSCPARTLPSGSVQLTGATPDADRRLVSALLHSISGRPYEACHWRAATMSQDTRRKVVLSAMRHMELYDAVLREFEHICCSFELVVSAACFGQLKRHRMMTLTSQPYDPSLGLTIPRAVVERGLDERFVEVARESEALYHRIAEHSSAAAPYALINAHRRRVLITLSARELYHVSRLREDHHAQWDIRAIAGEMIRQARDAMPLALILATGKDGYADLYTEVYGQPPRVIEAKLPGCN